MVLAPSGTVILEKFGGYLSIMSLLNPTCCCCPIQPHSLYTADDADPKCGVDPKCQTAICPAPRKVDTALMAGCWGDGGRPRPFDGQ